jgi:hypothetical protein
MEYLSLFNETSFELIDQNSLRCRYCQHFKLFFILAIQKAKMDLFSLSLLTTILSSSYPLAKKQPPKVPFPLQMPLSDEASQKSHTLFRLND